MTPASAIRSRLLKSSTSTLLTIVLIAALALNIATLTVSSVFNLMSSAIDLIAAKTVGEAVTIRTKHKAEVKNLKTQISDFEIKQRKTSAAVRNTTRRVAHRVAKATARSTSSIAAESIPYIGIGVIVGVTALELHDACETMKDLHALDVAFNPEAANDANEVCGQAVPTKGEIIDSVMESPSKAWNAATETVADLPSWDEALDAAKRKAWEMLEWMKILLGF
jgi:hypothetical protein